MRRFFNYDFLSRGLIVHITFPIKYREQKNGNESGPILWFSKETDSNMDLVGLIKGIIRVRCFLPISIYPL